MITVSLNTAIKLKEAGWIKETVFDMSEEGDIRSTKNNYLYKAPTAQEILDELPQIIGKCVLTVNKVDHMREGVRMEYCSGYMDRQLSGLHNGKAIAHVGVNASESLAKLRLRCKENGYLSFKTDE